MGRKIKRLTPEVVGLLESCPWPGNVRELENIIERIVAVEERETITASCLPAEILNAPPRLDAQAVLKPGFNLEAYLDQVATKYLQEAGQMAGGNMRKMAEILGLSYRSLRYLLDKYQIKSVKRADLRNGRDGDRLAT
jgi:two-component system response regulator PilR (NtrC family)